MSVRGRACVSEQRTHSLKVCACEMRFAIWTEEGRLFVISSYNRALVAVDDAAAAPTPNALWLGSLCEYGSLTLKPVFIGREKISPK